MHRIEREKRKLFIWCCASIRICHQFFPSSWSFSSHFSHKYYPLGSILLCALVIHLYIIFLKTTQWEKSKSVGVGSHYKSVLDPFPKHQDIFGLSEENVQFDFTLIRSLRSRVFRRHHCPFNAAKEKKWLFLHFELLAGIVVNCVLPVVSWTKSTKEWHKNKNLPMSLPNIVIHNIHNVNSCVFVHSLWTILSLEPREQ